METSKAPSGEAVAEAPQLPKLSLVEFRVYNRLADVMDQFVSTQHLPGQRHTNQQQHNGFRRTWKELYAASSTGKRPANISLRQFINTGLEFCHHLEMHHSIEESYLFPILAKKQPAFRKELELLTQHKQIHKGLDKFQEYLDACRSGERELRMEELKKLMDAFGGVLWEHL